MSTSSSNTPRPFAVVSGAAQGIGEGVARLLAQKGYSVALLDRNAQAAEAVAQALGSGSIALRADISSSNDVASAAAAIQKWCGAHGVQAAVHCAGVFDERKPLLLTELASLERILDVNVKGAFLFSKAIAPLLSAGACLIHVGSVNGAHAGNGLGAYKISKAALHMMSRCLALELAADPRRIRVNTVAPGWVDTPGERRILAADGRADFMDHPENAKGLPLQQFCLPKDIAEMIVFLCSPACRLVTGQIVYVDGGIMAR